MKRPLHLLGHSCSVGYFLNRFSNACRASFGRRLAGVEVSFSACHTNLIEGAVVARIFFFDAHRHGLHALEAASGIEIRALLAGVKFEAALGTKSGWRHSLQNRAALGTARDSARSRQVDRLRAHAVVAARWRADRSRLFRRLFARLILAVAVLISMLTVFRHTNLPNVGVLSRQSRGKTSQKFRCCFLLGVTHSIRSYELVTI